MSERYKTILFDDFSDGFQCDNIKKTSKSFKNSDSIIVEKNSIKLGAEIDNDSLYDMEFNSLESKKVCFVDGTYLYILGYYGSYVHIRKISYIGAISTVHSFGAGTVGYQLIKFKEKYIVSFGNPLVIQYSSDLTSWTSCGTVGTGMHILDHKIVAGKLYILCNNRNIYYSDDGISFTLLCSLSSYSTSFSSLEYLDGYFYVDSTYSGIIRISLSGEIQEEIVSLSHLFDPDMVAFNGFLYVLSDERYLYRVDNSSLKLIHIFSSDVKFLDGFPFVNLLFFSDINNPLFCMDFSEKIFCFHPTIDYYYILMIVETAVNFYVVHTRGNIALHHKSKYTSIGNIETREFQPKKGSFVPIQLTVSHKPLTANSWIKIYVKKDGASSWGSAIIYSNTTGAIKKEYNFPAGDNLKTIEFKIEYGTESNSETPENAILEFIYLPVDLANSQ